ncbi:hypothetical protein ACJMK2_008086 [Sinanodonta woodiana]|uniref:Uncharacterized protein n=1 Tax=Sinanodonta woodiana TaxID=1069815 RepID=A0ABD3VKR0_SINWO
MDIKFRFPTMIVFIVLSSFMMHLGVLQKPNKDQKGKQPSMSSVTENPCYMETGKIDLTLSVALILVAFCVGAAVMAVILCCTQEKWRSHISHQSTHHSSKSPAERSDHVVVTSGIHVQTSDSVYADSGDNEDFFANNVPVNVNRGDKHPELRVQWEPNDYEIVHEHSNRRSILEHPYGCVLAESDVNPITHNDMENNEAKHLEGEHGYLVLSVNEADGKNATEGCEIKIVDANHDYCVLASVERDGENLTEGNKIGKGDKNHDYFVLTSNELDGEMSLKKVK